MKILRVIGLTRPEDVPPEWPVYNAPRPLYGHKQWQGEFRHGIFYSAIDPTDTYIGPDWTRLNLRLDAWQVEYRTVEDARAWWEAQIAERAEESDPESIAYVRGLSDGAVISYYLEAEGLVDAPDPVDIHA